MSNADYQQIVNVFFHVSQFLAVVNVSPHAIQKLLENLFNCNAVVPLFDYANPLAFISCIHTIIIHGLGI